MPSTSSVSLSNNPDIDGVLSGVKWATTSLTFSFPGDIAFYGYTEPNFSPMNDAQKATVRQIMDMYESYTGLVLTEVTESASTHGVIRFGEESTAGTAYAYYPSASEYGGDVWLNPTDHNNPLKGTYSYATFMHEIGHAMGLDHGQDGLGSLPTNHDSLEYSVMTYRSFVGANLSGYTVSQGSYPMTLMLDDIAALQYMYGANYSTNSGNTVYTWSATTGEMSINGTGQGGSTANKILMTLWDGGGTDTYDFSNYATALNVDLSPGGWTTTSSAQLANLGGGFYPNQFARGNIANAYLYNSNSASLIENAIGGSGGDTLNGNQAANRLEGAGGDDILNGLDGDDTLVGGLGNDQLNGGTGVDYCILAVNFAACTITYDSSTLVYTLSSSATGTDRVGAVEYFTFSDGTRSAQSLLVSQPDTAAPTLLSTSPSDNASSVAVGANLVLTFSENVLAGSGNIVIYTSGGSVVATIAASDSSRVGISGATVTVNPTADLAAGADFYVRVDGTAFRDGSLNYFAGISSADAFNFRTASASTPTPTPPTGTTVNGSSGANTLNGTAGNDTINGLAGNDTLNGLDGHDTLDGGTGTDRMTGGNGNDTYIVDNTTDTVSESANAGIDLVKSIVTFTLGSNIENLLLTGSGAINGTGNTIDNVLTGAAGANTLNGNGGNDTLYGKGGSDTLTGGSGRDTFVFDTAANAGNIDRISDFNVVDDTIALSVSVFNKLQAGSLSANAFFSGASAADAFDRLIYNSSTGALYYDPDGRGGAGQQQIATLSKGLALTSADFLLIA